MSIISRWAENRQITTEAKKPSKDWSDKVKTKEKPPEGLFKSGSAQSIANWLAKNHDDKAGAVSALNFYVNRAGKNLSKEEKGRLDHAKELLDKKYPQKKE